MRTGVDRDLAVDVLIVGAGIAALHIARALRPHLSVCVVAEPGVRYESYDSAGRFAAGYDGNDVARIQPARRAAGYWRLWAESHGVPHDPAPSVHLVRPEDEVVRTRRWADAGLAFSRLAPDDVPPALASAAVSRWPAYATPDDVVIDPARVAAELRAGLGDRIVAATVQRFQLITPQAVDLVELALPDGTGVPVLPRFVVLAADAANATLLLKLAGAVRDRTRRKTVMEAARTSQAVRRRTTVLVRGDLPPLTAALDGFEITSRPEGDGDTVWIVQLPVDDGDTVVGPDDLRFVPTLDRKVVGEGVSRLFELCPDVGTAAGGLRWSAFVARQTEHPMVLDGDPARGAGPAPARLETMGMDALVAAWPSHLAYAMIVGDVVAERARAALGAPAPDAGPWPPDLPRPDPAAGQLHWHRAGHAWADWPTFAARAGLPI